MDVIEAAGGVILDAGKVVLVHRPKYDDWSFPKGKLDKGESYEKAAVREVEEETGLRCELGAFITEIEYPVEGVRKVVRFWCMAVRSGRTDLRPPTEEVDSVRWCPVDDAYSLLSYDVDREILRQVVQDECS